MPDPTGRVSHLPHFHRGVSWKQPVRVATTANITIATALNNGDSLDGVTLATGDRVLVKDQSTASQNGIYVVGASPGRDYDMDQDGTTTVPAEEIAGAFVWVLAGTVNGQTLWHSTNTSGGTLGSTSIVWTQFTSSGSTTSTPFDHGSMGAAETVDLADGDWHRGTLDANCTITVQGFTNDEGVVLLFEVTQDGTGGWDITWDSDVDFGGGDDQPSQTASTTTTFLLWSSVGDGTIYGAKVGGGTTDHGALTGLTDDDHPQYLKETDVAAKGDIYAASANDTVGVLTVGSNGQVLTADSGETLGVKWATPSSGTPPQILLESGHATPFTFDEILQESDGSDFLWASA